MPEAIPFKQGRTFSLIVFLDNSIALGQYRDWAVSAQLRRIDNRTPTGLLSNMQVTALNPDTANQYLIYHQDTVDWPVGLCEMDLRFENEDGFVVYSETLTFEIERVVTREDTV